MQERKTADNSIKGSLDCATDWIFCVVVVFFSPAPHTWGEKKNKHKIDRHLRYSIVIVGVVATGRLVVNSNRWATNTRFTSTSIFVRHIHFESTVEISNAWIWTYSICFPFSSPFDACVHYSFADHRIFYTYLYTWHGAVHIEIHIFDMF